MGTRFSGSTGEPDEHPYSRPLLYIGAIACNKFIGCFIINLIRLTSLSYSLYKLSNEKQQPGFIQIALHASDIGLLVLFPHVKIICSRHLEQNVGRQNKSIPFTLIGTHFVFNRLLA